MAEYSLPWTKDGGGDDGPYSADMWADWQEMLWQPWNPDSEGVVAGFGDELEATVPSANTVRIGTGGGLVKGRPYWSTSSVDVTVPSPAAATRIDRIVLSEIWADQRIRITRLEWALRSGADFDT